MRADVSESIYLLLFVLRYKRDFFRCYSASIMETATTSNNAIFAKKKIRHEGNQEETITVSSSSSSYCRLSDNHCGRSLLHNGKIVQMFHNYLYIFCDGC